MRYTFHGGGPCAGALNGAEIPDPLSSGSAGHPSSDHAFAILAISPGSVTRTAFPSTTTSASRIDTASEHRGSRATLRPLRVAPVWNQKAPSIHIAPTAVTCGLPSSFTVASHVVSAFTASGAGADRASKLSTTAVQSTSGSPSALPRLIICTVLDLLCAAAKLLSPDASVGTPRFRPRPDQCLRRGRTGSARCRIRENTRPAKDAGALTLATVTRRRGAPAPAVLRYRA